MSSARSTRSGSSGGRGPRRPRSPTSMYVFESAPSAKAPKPLMKIEKKEKVQKPKSSRASSSTPSLPKTKYSGSPISPFSSSRSDIPSIPSSPSVLSISSASSSATSLEYAEISSISSHGRSKHGSRGSASSSNSSSLFSGISSLRKKNSASAVQSLSSTMEENYLPPAPPIKDYHGAAVAPWEYMDSRFPTQPAVQTPRQDTFTITAIRRPTEAIYDGTKLKTRQAPPTHLTVVPAPPLDRNHLRTVSEPETPTTPRIVLTPQANPKPPVKHEPFSLDTWTEKEGVTKAKSRDGFLGVYKREQRQGWSGEWNSNDMGDVISKLRSLK